MCETFGKRVAVVTGANKGIGFAIVKELCTKFDGDVFLTSRNVERGKYAVNYLKRLGIHPRYHQLDIDDEKSVHKLKKYLQKNYGGLDILVNNAAIAFKQNSDVPLVEQAALTVGTNYFGTRRVCDALFPLLRPHARVVNLSSSAGVLTQLSGHHRAAIILKHKLASGELSTAELDHKMREFITAVKTDEHHKLGWPDNPYAVSKIAISALTKIQQREFDADPRKDLIVNAVNPGYVNTDMTDHMGYLTLEQGAEAPCWLALLLPNVCGPKGGFVWHDKQIVDWVYGSVDSAF